MQALTGDAKSLSKCIQDMTKINEEQRQENDKPPLQTLLKLYLRVKNLKIEGLMEGDFVADVTKKLGDI